MVRPVSINLSIAFSSMAVLMGGYRFDKKDLEELSAKGDPQVLVQQNKNKIENVLNLMGPQIEIIEKTKPNLVSVFQEIVQQLSTLKFLANIEGNENFVFDFEEILSFNPVVHDNSLGICPIPLYNFSVNEAESFLKKDNKDINTMILKKHAIHQFFFPPADSLALGLIENNSYTSKELVTKIKKVPQYGHPFGENELTDIKNIKDVVDALKERDE